MPLIAATGTSDPRIRPDWTKKSIAPARTCDSMSASVPSWLEGKMLMSTWPLVCSLILALASVSRTLSG